MPDGLFDGLTLVEIADRKNQYVGKLFSDAGAEVIQVEPLSGSDGRFCGPFVKDTADPNRCLDYWYYNTGKRSVCIDLARPAGQRLVARLAAGADIFIESGPPGRLSELGLGYGDLAQLSGDRIIYTSLTDFGQDGPWRDLLANEPGHLALGGQMASTGYSDPTLPPIGGQGHQSWHVAGVLAAQAIGIALIDRMSTGRGQYLDCAIHDCQAINTELAFPYWVYGNQVLYRITGTHAMNRPGPSINMPAADGLYVNTISTGLSQHHWVNLVNWMKEEGVAGELEDPKYLDAMERALLMRRSTAIPDAMARLIAKLPAAEAVKRAQSFQLTWSVVRAPEENLDDEHWQARGFFATVEHEGLGGALRYPGSPFKWEDAPLSPRRRAPNLGEDTAAVLRDRLGLDEAAIAGLQKAEVIGC